MPFFPKKMRIKRQRLHLQSGARHDTSRKIDPKIRRKRCRKGPRATKIGAENRSRRALGAPGRSRDAPGRVRDAPGTPSGPPGDAPETPCSVQNLPKNDLKSKMRKTMFSNAVSDRISMARTSEKSPKIELFSHRRRKRRFYKNRCFP